MDKKIKLANVTLVAVSSVQMTETIRALLYSMEKIEFGKVLLITHEKPENLPDTITFKKCKPLKNIDDYSTFMVYDLVTYIETPFLLHIHYDGYIIRPYKWQNAFLDYDFIGAPWPKGSQFSKDNTPVRVGNGACCIRSKKLLNAILTLNLTNKNNYIDSKSDSFNEDKVSIYHRKELEEYGVQFAPVELASQFSRETTCDDSVAEPFGFHKHMDLRPLSFLIKHFLFIDALKILVKPVLKPILDTVRLIFKKYK